MEINSLMALSAATQATESQGVDGTWGWADPCAVALPRPASRLQKASVRGSSHYADSQAGSPGGDMRQRWEWLRKNPNTGKSVMLKKTTSLLQGDEREGNKPKEKNLIFFRKQILLGNSTT